jgi:hypothetical protein
MLSAAPTGQPPINLHHECIETADSIKIGFAYGAIFSMASISRSETLETDPNFVAVVGMASFQASDQM